MDKTIVLIRFWYIFHYVNYCKWSHTTLSTNIEVCKGRMSECRYFRGFFLGGGLKSLCRLCCVYLWKKSGGVGLAYSSDVDAYASANVRHIQTLRSQRSFLMLYINLCIPNFPYSENLNKSRLSFAPSSCCTPINPYTRQPFSFLMPSYHNSVG